MAYTADEWVALIATHSDHATLPPAVLERLLHGVHDAIGALGGTVVHELSTALILAARLCHREHGRTMEAMATQVAQFRSVNPATEEQLETFDITSPADVDRALGHAVDAWRDWRNRSVVQRCGFLRDVAAVLRRDIDSHAATITAEMGKPRREACAEVEKCAFCCEYFAEEAPRFLGDEATPSDSPASFVTFEPLGTVLACMPWNFPYWQVFRCIGMEVRWSIRYRDIERES